MMRVEQQPLNEENSHIKLACQEVGEGQSWEITADRAGVKVGTKESICPWCHQTGIGSRPYNIAHSVGLCKGGKKGHLMVNWLQIKTE